MFQRGRPGIAAPEVSLERMGFGTWWIRATQLGQLQRLLACSHVAPTEVQQELVTRWGAHGVTLCLFLKAGGWEQEPGEVSLALIPTSGLWGSLSGQGRAGQGRALQRARWSLAWEGKEAGLICTADLHRLGVSEQDRDRLCEIPFHRKVPDSSRTSQISGETASSVWDAGCTSCPSPRKKPSCGMETAPGPGARSSVSSSGSCWEVPRETKSW